MTEESCCNDCKKEGAVNEEMNKEEIVEQTEQTEEKEEQKVKKKEEDFKSKYFYILAEMDNARKRYEREKEGLLRYGNDKILTALLEVMDNFDRTISSLGNDKDDKIKNIVTGIGMVRKQFLDVLSKFGLTQLETVGKKFDPNFHEAMAQQEIEGKEAEEILSEYLKGYVLNGRLIRAAKVIVVKNKE